MRTFLRQVLGTSILALLGVTAPMCAPSGAVTADSVASTQQPAPEQPKQQDEFVPISELPPQDQLPAAPLLVTAYAFVWVVLFAYVVSVGRRLSRVQREVERLDSDMKRGTRA